MNHIFAKDSDRQPYPWLRVLFGFAVGMLIFSTIHRGFYLAKSLYQGIGLGEYLMMVSWQFTTWQFWLYLFIPPAFLIIQRAERNRRGIMQAALSMFAIIMVVLIMYSASVPREWLTAEQLFYSLRSMLEQVVFAALLAGWLLPEPQDAADDAVPYPYHRVIIGFALLSGVLHYSLLRLLFAFHGLDLPQGTLPDELFWFFAPSLFFGVWFSFWRLQRDWKGIIHAVLVTLLSTAMLFFYFMIARTQIFKDFGLNLRELWMILAGLVAVTVLILGLLLFPADTDNPPAPLDYAGIIAVSLVITLALLLSLGQTFMYLLILMGGM